jgi:hypothetical protein
VENASRVLNGEPIQEDTSIKIKLITKDNVDEP